MNQYEKNYQIIKDKMWKYRKDDMIRKRGIFLKGVLYDHLRGSTIRLACEKRSSNTKYFYRWYNRLKDNNFDLNILSGYSKAPKSSPNEISEEIIDLAEEIRGDDSIGGHDVARILLNQHGIKVAGSTVCAHFKKRGISQIYKYKRVNSHKKRYAMKNPLERVQTDTTFSGFEDDNGNRIYLVPVVDDCSRISSVGVSDSKDSISATKALRKFYKKFGIPKVVQTDNGVEFTNKYISEENPRREKPARISYFEEELAELNIRHAKIAKGTPELNGKVERFNKTIKNALKNRLYNGITLEEAQKVVDEWVDWYNKIKPHASLNKMTPYQRFYEVLSA